MEARRRSRPLGFGASYYPEWWPSEEWEIDFHQMRDFGINTVRMGEFAWALFESEPGKFDFDWMDRALAVAARYHSAQWCRRNV